MTKVVYIYVSPTYKIDSLLDMIESFYKNEFDKNTIVYFVGIFTSNNQIIYDIKFEEQISNNNLQRIQEQIFTNKTNISKIKTRDSFISVSILDFLEKYREKKREDLQNFRWTTMHLRDRFFILCGNLYENRGIHCTQIGAKRFLSQIHFLQNFNKNDIFCGIDFKTCILRVCEDAQKEEIQKISYGQAITEKLNLRNLENREFVLGIEKGSFTDASLKSKTQTKVNTLYKMIIVSQPALETTFYDPFLSSFKEDVYFLSNIPIKWCRKNRELIACKFDRKTSYPNCSQVNIDMEKALLFSFQNINYIYKGYIEYYPKYFDYLIDNFLRYGYTNNFVTNNNINYVWFFFQGKDSSPSNGFTCDNIENKMKEDSTISSISGKRLSKQGKIIKTSNKTGCEGEYLAINSNMFRDGAVGKCQFNTYKKKTFELLYSFAEELTKFAIKQQNNYLIQIQPKDSISIKLQKKDKQQTKKDKQQSKKDRARPTNKRQTKKDKARTINRRPTKKDKERPINRRPTKIKKEEKMIKDSKVFDIGEKVKVRWLMTNGKYEWYEGKINKILTKDSFKVKIRNDPLYTLSLKDIRKL